METLLDNLAFPESPRWHAGRLWFSEMYLNQVQSVDTDGRAELVVRVDRQPSGLACMLGGPDRRSLYDCTASASYPDACRKRRDGRIEMLRVETPGAGLP